MSSAWEGCLSFPELLVQVPRHRRIRVEYLNARAEPVVLELEGFPARVVQHEFDHLEGTLTLDRRPRRGISSRLPRSRRWMRGNFTPRRTVFKTVPRRAARQSRLLAASGKISDLFPVALRIISKGLILDLGSSLRDESCPGGRPQNAAVFS